MLIDEKKCVGCGHCLPFCPQEAMSVAGVAVIDAERCKNCGICINYCPNDAVLEGEK